MAVIWSLPRMVFSKCRQPDGRDRTWMRLCRQFCCCVHRSSHCMGKSPEFVLLINGLQKWASWQFLEMFIFAFLVRCPVNRGFEVFLFVSSPILLGERGASHIRVWEQTRSYLGRRSLENIRRGLGETWIGVGRFF